MMPHKHEGRERCERSRPLSKTNSEHTKHSMNPLSLAIPEKLCCGCGGSYRVAWSFSIVATPSGITVFELCGRCSRDLRYCDDSEREQLAARFVERTIAGGW